MLFIYWQVIRFAVELAGTGKHNLDTRIRLTAGFQNGKLRRSVDVEISLRVGHGIDVAGLTRQVEQVVLALQQVGHGERVTHIRDIHRHFVANIFNIERITTVLRDQAIDQGDASALGHQRTGQIRADKAQAAGDEDLFFVVSTQDCFSASTA